MTHEVDFAAFVFAQDDWTTNSPPASPPPESGQASPRDNVVFEAGLFGGALGMRRTFILHASGAKLPSDLLGLTCVRYGEATTAAEMRVVNQKLRKAIENEGRVARIEGLWWQFSLTERTAQEPSAVSLLRISRDRDGALEVAGRSWQEDGTPVSQILERSGEGEEGAFRRLLLLEGRTAAGPERAAVGRDGGDPDGVRRSRVRVLHNSCGHGPESERADGRCLLARRSGGHEHPGRTRRSATRGVDRRAAEALEVDQERLRSAHVIIVTQALGAGAMKSRTTTAERESLLSQLDYILKHGNKNERTAVSVVVIAAFKKCDERIRATKTGRQFPVPSIR